MNKYSTPDMIRNQNCNIIYYLMPKKHPRSVQYHKDNKKSRMRRVLAQRLKRFSQRQFTFKTCRHHQLQSESSQISLVKVKQKKAFKKRSNINFIQCIHYPINTDCVFSLYGMITIDEKALRYESKDQSLIKALFNFYSLSEVQVNQDYLLLKIHKNKQNYFPISYIIERFKSHGDLYFYQMAQKIDQIRNVFEHMAALPTSSMSVLPQKQIDKYIQMVKGKKAMLRIAPNCMIFTKELLQIGDHTVQEMAIQCLKYRSLVAQIFLADNYRGQVNKFFELYELGKKLRLGEIDQQEYLQLSRQREVEYIMDNKNNMRKVITNKYSIAVGVGCWQIEKQVSQQLYCQQAFKQLNDKKKWYSKEIESNRVDTLKNLTRIGENINKDNRNIVCSYKHRQTNEQYI